MEWPCCLMPFKLLTDFPHYPAFTLRNSILNNYLQRPRDINLSQQIPQSKTKGNFQTPELVSGMTFIEGLQFLKGNHEIKFYLDSIHTL